MMNNNSYFYIKNNLEGVVDVVACEMEGVDKNWNVITMDIVVNASEHKLIFYPMYLSGNDFSEKALVLQRKTRDSVESIFLHFYNIDKTKSKWNKLRLHINNNFLSDFSIEKKYDSDLDWLYRNKNHRHKLTLADELQLISFEGLPNDYDRFWCKDNEVC